MHRIIIFAFIMMILLSLFGMAIPDSWYQADYLVKNLAPTLSHPFGTDFIGRDMFFRTLKGLSISLQIGAFAALISTFIATVLGVASGYFGGMMDKLVNWLIDLSLSLPHLIQLMLIAFMLGGGIFGVVVAISVTHWGSLTRVIRSEVLQLKTQPYITISYSFGKKHGWILKRHILPDIMPQILTGFTLIFPHAILHESAITFIGYGLPIEQPAIGNILSEAMKHLITGQWWLTLFPGLVLLILVFIFYQLAAKWYAPYNRYQNKME